jgi:hypothetical protein
MLALWIGLGYRCMLSEGPAFRLCRPCIIICFQGIWRGHKTDWKYTSIKIRASNTTLLINHYDYHITSRLNELASLAAAHLKTTRSDNGGI